MPSKNWKILIDSVLDGQDSLNYFSKDGGFKNSLALDPDNEAATGDNRMGGVLTPTPSSLIGNVAAEPLWMRTNPKNDDVYVYAQNGRVYSVILASYTLSNLNNGVALTASSGNGMEYYDNYYYFSKNTDVCRYGPLSGVSLFTQTYWSSTLALTALGNGVTYPSPKIGTSKYPNHVLHRHSDGKLYILDVMASNGVHTGKGSVHFIKTTKTTVEGDTNDGSTYNALDLPYGVWPTDIESFGTDVSISAYEGNTTSGNTRGLRSHLYLWDTTSSSFYKDIDDWDDPLISALEIVNGELWVFSGNPGSIGCRVSRHIGGYSFEEIAYFEDSHPPLAGATDSIVNRVIFGGFTSSMGNYGCLYAIGSRVSKVTQGLFNIMRSSTGTSNGVAATSCLIPENTDFTNPVYLLGWRDGNEFGIDRNATTYGDAKFQSEVFKIGKPFEVELIRIPVNQALAANMTVIVKIVVDQESTSTTVSTINSTNYSGSERFIEIRPSVRGKHDFFLEFDWSGTELISLNLPIEVHGRIIEE